ncbi:meiotic recombination protein SPO11-1 isoform X2 [Malus domestica]|uniref:meiotic recombination protein SPO11-1 isoform X2 n=1 Tax=Malus domestica TaxID=3750 RepID=UPI003976AF43
MGLRGISITCILLYFQVSVGKGYCQCSSVHTCCGERIRGVAILIFPQEGKESPSNLKWEFLGLLVDTLHLPIYCLVDCDPYGFDILSMYRFGSMQMAYDAKFLRVPEVLWLGAFPFGLRQVRSSTTVSPSFDDKRKTEAMLLRCYLQNEAPPQWRLELQLMLERGVKFELEALSVHELNYLSEVYIPSKLQGGVHI